MSPLAKTAQRAVVEALTNNIFQFRVKAVDLKFNGGACRDGFRFGDADAFAHRCLCAQGTLTEAHLEAVQVIGNLARGNENQAVNGFLVGFQRGAVLAARIARLTSSGKGLAAVLKQALYLVVVDKRCAVGGFWENCHSFLCRLRFDVIDFLLGQVIGGSLAGNVGGQKLLIAGAGT